MSVMCKLMRIGFCIILTAQKRKQKRKYHKGVKMVDKNFNLEPLPADQNLEETAKQVRISSNPVLMENLIETARAFENQCADYTVSCANPRTVHLNGDGKLTFIDDYGDDHTFSISHLAMGQLGQRIGVPGNYIEKCIKNGRIDLAQKNINSWIRDYNRSLFIRVYNGKIRGVLTDKYSVCDSPEILEIVNEVVDQSAYEIKGFTFEAEQFHLRLVSRNKLNVDGEDLSAGFFINSSDVGLNALTVEYGIFKKVCTNGLYLPKLSGVLFQQRHRGITPIMFYDKLATSLLKIKRLSQYAVDMIDSARVRKCLDSDINWTSDKDIEKLANRIQQRTQLSCEGAIQVIIYMRQKYGTSHWGLVNSITDVAQQYSLERRLELEHIAGNLLGL